MASTPKHGPTGINTIRFQSIISNPVQERLYGQLNYRQIWFYKQFYSTFIKIYNQ